MFNSKKLHHNTPGFSLILFTDGGGRYFNISKVDIFFKMMSLTHNREYWNASVSWSVIANNFYQFGILDSNHTQV